MKQIVLDRVIVGNARYTATLEISEDVENALLRQGALRILQGSPSSAAEKELAYPGKTTKRPEGFKRTDIPYGEDMVRVFGKHYKDAEIEVGRDANDEPVRADLGVTEISFEEYTGPEKAEPKFKAEKDLLKTYLFEADGTTVRNLKSGAPRTAASFAESRGLTAPTEPWDEDVSFLAEVKAWYKAQAASQD